MDGEESLDGAPSLILFSEAQSWNSSLDSVSRPEVISSYRLSISFWLELVSVSCFSIS